ncbi:MAG: hypothetical protein LBL13_11505 [Bacteroidales bacterium]|nr:hypothetical protein [Bacteroidales bacterium]
MGHIEIRVVGNEGNNPLTPDNYDIREIRAMLENIEDMLYPGNKKIRPDITYQIGEGSVRNIFKTSLQAVVSFTAVAGMISNTNSIDGLELSTAKAIENIQSIARSKDYSFEIKTSESENIVLKITPQTQYERSTNLWVDAEFYFYGVLVNAGGKNKANIHLDTKETGMVVIETDKVFLKDEPDNLLYKEYGVRVIGKQNLETGEIDRSNLKLVQLIDYSPKYDEAYLNNLIAKASPKFKNLDPDLWLREMRGGYNL